MAVCEADRLLSEVLDSTTGLPVAWAADEDVQKIMSVDIWPAFFEQTETGRRFAEDYLFDEKIQNRIAQEFARRFGVAGEINSRHSWPGAVFVSRLEEVIGDLLRTNDPSLTLANPPEPETPAPERPRDSRGRFVNEIAQEVQDDLNGNTTTRDIKEKIRTSPQYRTEWEKAHATQAQKTVSAANDLRAFADSYIRTPADQLKPSPSGLVTIGGKSYNREEFEDVLTRATAARLI